MLYSFADTLLIKKTLKTEYKKYCQIDFKKIIPRDNKTIDQIYYYPVSLVLIIAKFCNLDNKNFKKILVRLGFKGFVIHNCVTYNKIPQLMDVVDEDFQNELDEVNCLPLFLKKMYSDIILKLRMYNTLLYGSSEKEALDFYADIHSIMVPYELLSWALEFAMEYGENKPFNVKKITFLSQVLIALFSVRNQLRQFSNDCFMGKKSLFVYLLLKHGFNIGVDSRINYKNLFSLEEVIDFISFFTKIGKLAQCFAQSFHNSYYNFALNKLIDELENFYNSATKYFHLTMKITGNDSISNYYLINEITFKINRLPESYKNYLQNITI
jgi:hypothetical protein